MKLLRKFAGVLGIVLMIVFAGSVVFWEFIGRDMLTYQEVIVFNTAIKKGDVIDSKNISIKKIEHDDVINNAITNREQLVGMAANNYIPANIQIVPEFITEHGLSLNKDQFIFKVPVDWIKAIPSSIRRKDKISFFEVVDKDALSKDQTKVELPSDDTTKSSTYTTYKDSDTSLDIKPNDKPILCSISAAYVKDNTNREVVTISELERYDGSSQVSDLEIIVTSAEVEILKKSVENGNKFLISYQEN